MNGHTPWRTARRMFALHQGGNDWYRIRNQKDGPALVSIYDEIGYFGTSANSFIKDLGEVDGPIELHLNSPGGEVFDGLAIYNTLMARDDVTVVVDGIAASIASVIAMAGTKVLLAKQAQMMIHEGHAMAIGNAQDMRELADALERTSNSIADVYAEHAGKDRAHWRGLMRAETWFTAEEAIAAGLADGYAESSRSGPAPRGDGNSNNEWDMSVFRSAPDLRQRNRAPRQEDAASVPYVSERQTRHEPMTGRHAHDHAAYGAADHDDGQHHHVHEHVGDAHHDPSSSDGHHVHSPGMGHEGQDEQPANFRAMLDLARQRGVEESAVQEFARQCGFAPKSGNKDSGPPSQDAGPGNKDHGELPWVDPSEEEIANFMNALKGV